MGECLTSRKIASLLVRGIAAAILPVALLAGISSADSTTTTTTTTSSSNIPIPTPTIAGVPALPGPIAASATISSTIGVLAISPLAGGPVGSNMTISGSGLPATTNVQLTWATQNATWNVDPEPNTVNYMGRTVTNVTVNLASVTTNASGAFSLTMKVPNDFGGTHEIYAVINSVDVLEGAFITTRTLTVTPRSGPIGTPVTVTYTGMGSSLFQNSAAVLWDNHFAGELISEWTRGTGTTVLQASGPVGKHVLMVGDALTDLYLNPLQSPYPFMNGASVIFKVTKDNGPPTPSISWPASVAPTLLEQTTLQPGDLSATSTAVATLSNQGGPVGTPVALTVTGLSGTGTDQIAWATEGGSRVDCNSVTGLGCWIPLTSPLGTGVINNGKFTSSLTVPNSLGGWHMILVMSGTTIEAQVPYYVKESIVPFYNPSGKLLSEGVATWDNSPSAFAVGGSGTGTYKFKEGQQFTISIKGVGWTQLDNTLAVDYDNSYVGYGCGFNSNGYLVLHLQATGGPGTHVIDLHPMLYTSQPAFANTPFGLAPVLSSANDYPGLALGYQVPTFHFAITIVK